MRLRELFGEERGVKAEIARVANCAHTVAARWYDGKVLPEYSALVKISLAKRCNLNWLLTGEGEPLAEPDHVRESQPDYHPIRVVGRASATADATIDWEEVEHETVELGPAVAIRVVGDSMEDLARAGQHVLAVPDGDLKDGDLAVLRVRRRGVYFKRVFFHPKGMVELQSHNKLSPQPAIFIKATDIIKQYRVIGVAFE